MPIVQLEIDSSGALTGAKQFETASDKITKSTKKTTGALDKLKTGLKGIGTIAATGLAAVGTAMVGVGTKGVQMAGELEITQQKFDTVFKGMEDSANSWAEELQSDYRLTEEQSKRYLSSIQDMLKPMGVAEQKAGDMSQEMVKLASDLASFNAGVTMEDAMRDIQAALAGSTETMSKYGVVVKQTDIENEAYKQGLIKTKDELGAAEKAQALFNLMMEGSKDAIGSTAASMDTYQGQMDQLRTNLAEITTKIGQVLMPYVMEFVGWLVEWTSKQENLNLVMDTTKVVVDGIKGAVIILQGAVDLVYASFSKMIQVITKGLATMLKPFTGISKKAKTMHDNLENASEMAGHFSKAAWEGLQENIDKLGNLTGKTDELTGSMGQATIKGGELNDTMSSLKDKMLEMETNTDKAKESTKKLVEEETKLYQTMQLVNGEWTNQAGAVSSLSNTLGIVIPQVEGLGEAQMAALTATKESNVAIKEDVQAKQQAAAAATTLAGANNVAAASYNNMGQAASNAAVGMQQGAAAAGGGTGAGGGQSFGKGYSRLPEWFSDEMAREYARHMSDVIIKGTPHLGALGGGPGTAPSRSWRDRRSDARSEYYQQQFDPYAWARMQGYDPVEGGYTESSTGGGITVNVNQEMTKDQLAALIADLERAQARG